MSSDEIKEIIISYFDELKNENSNELTTRQLMDDFENILEELKNLKQIVLLFNSSDTLRKFINHIDFCDRTSLNSDITQICSSEYPSDCHTDRERSKSRNDHLKDSKTPEMSIDFTFDVISESNRTFETSRDQSITSDADRIRIRSRFFTFPIDK
jgi:hypothetical protein